MKTTTKILSIAIISALVITWTASTYAMWNGNGQWNWQGQWMGKNQWLKQWHSIKKHSPNEMLKDIAISDLSLQETQDLYYQYNEEKVARDLYNHFYSLYGTQTFANIASSEQEHMDSVKTLLDRYLLQAPTTYGELQSTFDSLKSEWSKWLKNALEVWIKIETLDINDIVDTIKTTDNDDLKIIFTNIWGASYNHMRWFLKALNSNNFTTDIDYSKYLTQELVNSTWSLKYLLSDKLTAEWIVLPIQVNSTNMKENCTNKQYNTKENSTNEESNKKAREWYKSQINKKYWNSIKNFDNTKLQTIDWKIDLAIEKVENSNTLTGSVKQDTLNLYYALKDYLSWLFR